MIFTPLLEELGAAGQLRQRDAHRTDKERLRRADVRECIRIERRNYLDPLDADCMHNSRSGMRDGAETGNGKTPTLIIRKIRDAILDEVFKPGDWLPELDLAARFQVSRSPVREALLALEKEGTVVTNLVKGPE